MEDLETVLPGGVQVTTLEPTRDKDGHITLRSACAGSARPGDSAGAEPGALQAFSAAADCGRKLRNRAEAPDQRMEPVSASNRVNFEMLADYNPAPPGNAETPASSAELNHLSGTAGANEHAYAAGRASPTVYGHAAKSSAAAAQGSAAMNDRAVSTWQRTAGFSADAGTMLDWRC